MDLLNSEISHKFIQMTWRNPAFMAVSIALIWLIPQIVIRRIMANNYNRIKLAKQKQKIARLYPESLD